MVQTPSGVKQTQTEMIVRGGEWMLAIGDRCCQQSSGKPRSKSSSKHKKLLGFRINLLEVVSSICKPMTISSCVDVESSSIIGTAKHFVHNVRTR